MCLYKRMRYKCGNVIPELREQCEDAKQRSDGCKNITYSPLFDSSPSKCPCGCNDVPGFVGQPSHSLVDGGAEK